jgi:hyaluronan synthase
MSSLLQTFVRDVLGWTFGVYVTVVIGHLLLQIFYADRNHRRSKRLVAQAGASGFHPSVDVIVPCYNEQPDALQACLEALALQRYPGALRVYVVDDGSTNRDQLRPVYEAFRTMPGWQIVLCDENAGKRHAHDRGFRLSHGELVVTIDSDTRVAPDGIRQIVSAFQDGKVAGATGFVGVANARQNVLTRIIGLRYWIAFNQERAAQSWFRSVLCCSGAFAVYRRSALEPVWDRYVTQTYHGVACTYGDDRHLTNLLLGEGHDVLYVPEAHCETEIPHTLRGFARQQLRWNKSFYREFLWTLPFVRSRPWYMTFEIACQLVVPFLYTLALIVGILSAIFIDPRYFVNYAVSISVMAVARSAYALWRTRDTSYLLLVAYGFLHLVVLTPIRFRAMATLTNTSWGTRGGTVNAQPEAAA